MKIMIGIVTLLGFFILFFINIYQSSPGYTTREYSEEFYKNAPECLWISILLNKKASWGDAPWRSLCMWYLKIK